MKIAILGHTYWESVNRQKIYELARQSDHEIKLFIPERWRGSIREECGVKKFKWDRGFEIITFPIKNPGKFYDYTIIGVEEKLIEFQPDIIHIEAEPPSKAFSQITKVLNKIESSPKLTFFTWENLHFSLGFFPNRREKKNLQFPHGAIAGSLGAKNLIEKKGFTSEVLVCPQLGVDLDLFYERDVSELKKKHELEGFVIGYLGRFSRSKGLHTLIEAVSKLEDNFTLFFVGGGGEMKDQLPELIEKHGLEDKTKIFGPVSATEVPDYLCTFDLTVLPSISLPTWTEQFGHVLIEAMASGVPIIGSDSGAIPDVIGDAGLVFSEGNVDELKNCLEKIMTDNTLREKLIANGKVRVQDYTFEHISKMILKFWEKLAK